MFAGVSEAKVIIVAAHRYFMCAIVLVQFQLG